MGKTRKTNKTLRKRNWRDVFLEALRRSGCVSYACEQSTIARPTVYAHRERFPKFRAAWDEALEISVELLETAARHRALSGPDDPKSATLLIFLLKAHKPEKYRDNAKAAPDVTTARDAMMDAEAADADFDAQSQGTASPAPAEVPPRPASV